MPRTDRLAYAVLAVVLTVLTVIAVYDPTKIPFFDLKLQESLKVLFVAVPLGLVLIYMMLQNRPADVAEDLNRLGRLRFQPDEQAIEEEPLSYRTASSDPLEAELVAVDTGHPMMKKLVALPGEFSAMLEHAGDGTPAAFYEIHEGIAFVAVVRSDAVAISDFISVLLRLENRGPRFEARPLVALDPLPPNVVKFKKEPAFSSAYVVEGIDGKAVRSYLSGALRDELVESPDVWVRCEGKVLSLTLFGEYKEERLIRLLDVADVFFAEYGDRGGPTLLEPTAGRKRKAKKKRKPVIEEDDGDDANAADERDS